MRVSVLNSISMAPEDRGHAPEENSRAAAGGKRRQLSSADDSPQHLKKRIRTVSEPERQTLKREGPPQNTAFSSNRFWPIRCSSQQQQRDKSREPEASRKWLFSSRDLITSEDKVVVVSYNILGVKNASQHLELYKNTTPQSLDWGQRKKRIHDEINHYGASILCFQEVDRFDDVNDAFQKDGFKGVYKARTGDACDGCAIFWRENLFRLLHQENIEFKNFDLRYNVAQLCILELRHNSSESNLRTQTSMTSPTRSRILLIGNIHVLYNRKRGDIKLGQVRLFLERAYKLSQEWGGIPVILAGDLNCVPESAMYQFLSSSELEIQLHDRRAVSGQVEERPTGYRALRSQKNNVGRWTAEEIKLAAGIEGATHLEHHLNLSSAYPGIPGGWRTRDKYGEPRATTYHANFMGTVDYIWHTKELVPVRVLETLPTDVLRRTGGLPTKKWGSDHLALVCELAFTDDDDGSTWT